MSLTSANRRVVITGMGVICPLGNSPAEVWEALSSGRSGVEPLQSMPALDGLVTCAGEARTFTGHIDDFGTLPKDRKKAIRKALKVMCRETMMAVAAAQQAIDDGGFSETAMDPERSGVVFGSDYMLSPPEDFIAAMNAAGVAEADFRFSDWGVGGLGEMNPLWMLKYLPNMPASHIGIFNDLRGPNNSLTLREASGSAAIREAAQTIARGHADRMVAGATGTRVHSFKTIHATQVEPTANPELPPAEASRPFDRDRTGMVVGEGAGALLLEEFRAAEARGAKIYGEVIGAASVAAAAAAELNSRTEQALALAIRGALREAPIEPAAVGHVAAHGLGTPRGDAAEAKAIAMALGAGDEGRPVVAAKSYFGNLGAASGIVELIGSLLAIDAAGLYQTLNFKTPDPECPVRIAEPGESPGDSCLQLSVTPQGQAVAVLVARHAAH